LAKLGLLASSFFSVDERMGLTQVVSNRKAPQISVQLPRLGKTNLTYSQKAKNDACLALLVTAPAMKHLGLLEERS